jgi:hypothetical protein
MDGNLLELQSTLRNNGMLISFSGRFSQGIIEELGDAIRKHMEAEDRPKNDIHNVFGIFIEQTQNIKNYSSKKTNTDVYNAIADSGIVSIGKLNSVYFIWSGNIIEDCDKQRLQEKLDRLKALDKIELKKLYKDKIRELQDPDSCGAGIGLIDIARKASFPIEYSIEKLDDKFSFFQIKVIV